MRAHPPPPRAGRIHWMALAYMLGFAVLLTAVSVYYLIPAMEAALGAADQEKRQLVATSRLLLAVVLFVLFVGLWLTFRVGRFFLPRSTGEGRTKTPYVDAWAESARRMQAPPRASDDEDDR